MQDGHAFIWKKMNAWPPDPTDSVHTPTSLRVSRIIKVVRQIAIHSYSVHLLYAAAAAEIQMEKFDSKEKFNFSENIMCFTENCLRNTQRVVYVFVKAQQSPILVKRIEHAMFLIERHIDFLHSDLISLFSFRRLFRNHWWSHHYPHWASPWPHCQRAPSWPHCQRAPSWPHCQRTPPWPPA